MQRSRHTKSTSNPAQHGCAQLDRLQTRIDCTKACTYDQKGSTTLRTCSIVAQVESLELGSQATSLSPLHRSSQSLAASRANVISTKYQPREAAQAGHCCCECLSSLEPAVVVAQVEVCQRPLACSAKPRQSSREAKDPVAAQKARRYVELKGTDAAPSKLGIEGGGKVSVGDKTERKQGNI